MPVFIAQIASVGMMFVDTVVLGYFGARDLAAVAIGGGIYISIVFALVGIVQAVAPMVALRVGGGRHGAAADVLQHGLLLAIVLALPGMFILFHPGFLLALSTMDADVEQRVREYLALLAYGLPASLLYRTFYAYCNGLGRGRPPMLFGIGGLLLHALLAWGFASHGWTGVPLGALGCALSNVSVSWLEALLSIGLLWLGGVNAGSVRPLAALSRFDWHLWREMLRLGVPMGLASFVEITAFTLVALFIAPLGSQVVAGHRVVANLSALTYMLPLSLAIATLSATGRAVGARDWPAARSAILTGTSLAGGLSSLVGILLWLFSDGILAAYGDDPQVRAVAAGLVAYVALYQFFDALQTVAGNALRAYRVTFLPMLMQVACFWGIGVAGGWWLCFRGQPPLGVAGFWLASVLSLLAVAVLLCSLLVKVVRMAEKGA